MLTSSLLLAAGPGCTRAEPPSPPGTPWIAAPDVDAGTLLPVAVAPAADASPIDARYAPDAGAGSDAASDGRASPAAGANGGADGGWSEDSALLPQTTEKPAPSSPALDARIALLWKAIVDDDPGVATPSFFPLGAYQQVKDVPDPAADWKRRLLAAYRRDIHAFHAALGDDAGAAKLVSFVVPDARARWVEPGEEWNKIGYFRVFNAKIHYELNGEDRTFEVKSLISWRGEWFVVHLAAIK